MTETIYNVEATALFYARPEPLHTDLLDALNARFETTPGCYLTKSPLSHDDWWLLSCEAFHIMISFKDHVAPSARFADAVSSPINSLNRFEYEHVAQNHHAHLNIEIGDGSAPLPPEARKIMQEFGSVSTCDADLKLKALHLTSQFIAQHAGFLALHFAPSDRMLSPEDLKSAASQDVPVTLLLHPVPTDIALDSHGRETYELRLKNPHHLSGPPIELEGIPRAVPLSTSVTLLTTLFKANRAGKVTLKHGDVLSPSKKWSLYVHMDAANDDTPDGSIVLSFYKDRAKKVVIASDDASASAGTPLEVDATKDAKRPFGARALASLRKAKVADPEPAKLAEPVVQKPAPVANTSSLTNIVTKPQSKRDAVSPNQLRPVDQSTSQAAKLAIASAPKPAPQNEAGKAPRVSLLGWMVDRCETVPMDSRVRSTGIAIIAGLLTWANPYADFTGGYDVTTQTHAAITSKALAPITQLAALSD
ncbi:MAG: hypothetical protein ABJL99_01040 [Aliishimia sp.]